MDVLWVTTFNETLFEASGSRMLETWEEFCRAGRLLVCTEGVDARRVPEGRFDVLEIGEHPWLLSWLRDNAGIIPESLGGTHDGSCSCNKARATPRQIQKGTWHNPNGCPADYFHRNASRWFRKQVALAEALELEPDLLLWVDCDFEFFEYFGRKEIDAWFQGAGLFWLKGPSRPAPETGIFGARRDRGAIDVIDTMVGMFRDGSFRREARWDDSWMLEAASKKKKHRRVRVIDNYRGYGARRSVVELSPLGKFMRHFKGEHRISGLMS